MNVPITFPTKLSAPMIELNKNSEDALTTALATELASKHRYAESTSAAQEKIVTISNSETDTKEEDNNNTGAVSL